MKSPPSSCKEIRWQISRFLTLLPARLLGRVRNGHGLLLVASGGLGDNVLLSTVISSFMPLAEKEEPITLLIRKNAAAVSFLFPPALKIEIYDWRKFRKNPLYRLLFCLKMRRKGFRLVVSTDYERHPMVDELILLACGTRLYGEKAKECGKFQKLANEHEAFFTRLIEAQPSHRVLHWIHLAKALTGQDVIPPRFPSSCCQSGPVLIHLGTADARKKVSDDFVLEILEKIPPKRLLLLSLAPGEKEGLSKEWKKLIAQGRIKTDERSLKDKFETLQTASLLITVDTCLIHLAALAGTPTLCLCSAAYIGWAVPYDPSFAPPNIVFYHEDCPHKGCLGQCVYPLVEGRFACMKKLSANRAETLMESVLERSLKGRNEPHAV